METSIRKALLTTLDTNRRADLIWRSRIRLLSTNRNHMALANGPKIFLHLVPLGTEQFSLDRYSQQLDDSIKSLHLLLDQYAHYHRINIDGFLGYSTSGQVKSDIVSYYQVFWDGSIEFCNASYLNGIQPNSSEMPTISLPLFEFHFVNSLKRAISFLQKNQIPLPVRLYLAVIGAQGYTAVASRHSWPEHNFIDRNELFFDPVTLDDWEADLGQSLRPLFDQLWNAGNFVRSFSYDESGDWKPRTD